MVVALSVRCLPPPNVFLAPLAPTIHLIPAGPMDHLRETDYGWWRALRRISRCPRTLCRMAGVSWRNSVSAMLASARGMDGANKRMRIAVDIGGTFTDATVFDEV